MDANLPGTADTKPTRPASSGLDCHEEEISSVLQCASETGFANFDSLVLAYYTEAFRNGTSIANAQRISRNRNLPYLLRNLMQSSSTWTPWEVRSFNDEIIKAAETILIKEIDHKLVQVPLKPHTAGIPSPRHNVAASSTRPAHVTNMTSTDDFDGNPKLEDEVRCAGNVHK
jgi:hypothetical protein